MRYPAVFRRLTLPACAFLGSLAALPAQTSPAAKSSTSSPAPVKAQSVTPTATTASGEEAIVLSPFEIKEGLENEWDSKSTLLGNRTSQELVKVPVSVDVLTKGFMA